MFDFVSFNGIRGFVSGWDREHGIVVFNTLTLEDIK